MNAQTNRKTEATARDVVQVALLGFQPNETVSIKAALATIRDQGSHLTETDCELVELVVEAATMFGRSVAFDVKEP